MQDSSTFTNPATTMTDRQALRFDENTILKDMLASSTDACWCIEFSTPVDLTAPDREVIRQVFENGPFWRFCNDAMGRLYRLPDDVDFNTRPVREIFPRNRDNEHFILRLIRNGFELNAAPALDTRYDGVQIYVENDVRAHIVNGQLLRMFGVVRNVEKQQRREQELKKRIETLSTILAALPEAVVVFNQSLQILAANTATGRLFRVNVDDLPGRSLEILLSRTQENTAELLQEFAEKLTQCNDSSDTAEIHTDNSMGLSTRWKIGFDDKGGNYVALVTITCPLAEQSAGGRDE